MSRAAFRRLWCEDASVKRIGGESIGSIRRDQINQTEGQASEVSDDSSTGSITVY
jgi:hypothetical protein